ncbi:MAG: prepilin-type N-terminal cleavage/methylation domain-containing protein [Acidimicrobiales bacterium]
MNRCSFARLSSRRARNRHVNQESRGFTLIELLTVVVVIGVVSAVAAMAMGRLNEKSMSAACSADATKISNAVSLVEAQYPGTTVNESILLTRGGAYDGPYLLSWPNNRPHYDFYFVAGVLNIQSPAGSATTSGTTLAAGEPFASSTACTGVTS